MPTNCSAHNVGTKPHTGTKAASQNKNSNQVLIAKICKALRFDQSSRNVARRIKENMKQLLFVRKIHEQHVFFYEMLRYDFNNQAFRESKF